MVRNMVAELYSTLSEDMKTRARKKIQSAMEYLMTYGWAILIIAVVLVVLFLLGITNPLFCSESHCRRMYNKSKSYCFGIYR